MRFKYQTIPPECHCCGVMSHKGCDVDRFSDLDDDPKWGNWLCPRCRTAQQSGQTPLLAWTDHIIAREEAKE